MKYVAIKHGPIPGMDVKEKTAYAELGGRWWPVMALLADGDRGVIPLLNIRQMSDEDWKRHARASFLRKYEQEHGKQAEFPEDAYRAYCDDIRRMARGLPEPNIPVVYCYG